METALAIGIGIIIGAALGYLLAKNQSSKVSSDLALERNRAETLSAQLKQVSQQAQAREQELAFTHAQRLNELSATHQERVTELVTQHQQRVNELKEEHEKYVTQVKGDSELLKQQFTALAADVMKSSNAQFLEIADERLKRAHQQNAEELAKRETAVKNLVDPVAKALDDVKRQTTEAEERRIHNQAQLAEQVRNMVEASDKLDRKTTAFINTLRRSDVRGNWGEVQLRRVVELAGMQKHVDFDEQESVRDDDGKNLRPDMTIHLSGGRTIVVDSKVALHALIEAFETEDEAIREDRLRAHARQVKTHVDQLAAKEYWKQFSPAPEFVIMFVPSEAFYQAAVEQDSALQEYAFTKNVFIATPTTLVAMLRAVAYAWKEEALAASAKQVLATGKELYERLVTMADNLASVGKAIDRASAAYNKTVGTLEARVLPSARKFQSLQHLDKDLPELTQSDTLAREISAPELRAAIDADSTDTKADE